MVSEEEWEKWKSCWAKLNARSFAHGEEETKTMQSVKTAEVLNVSEGGLEDKAKNLTSSLDNGDRQHVQIDSGTALQQFLDRIPINSIPGIKNSPGTFITFVAHLCLCSRINACREHYMIQCMSGLLYPKFWNWKPETV